VSETKRDSDYFVMLSTSPRTRAPFVSFLLLAVLVFSLQHVCVCVRVSPSLSVSTPTIQYVSARTCRAVVFSGGAAFRPSPLFVSFIRMSVGGSHGAYEAGAIQGMVTRAMKNGRMEMVCLPRIPIPSSSSSLIPQLSWEFIVGISVGAVNGGGVAMWKVRRGARAI